MLLSRRPLLFTFLVASLLIFASADFEDIVTNVYSVSTASDQIGSKWRNVGLEGGAYLYIKGSGFSTKSASSNRVTVGDYACEVVEFLTTPTMVVCVVPPVPEEGSLKVRVFVDSLRIGTCDNCYIYFSYWNTPQLAYMLPNAGNPGEEIKFYGKPVVSSSLDIDFIKIGDYRCDSTDQNEFSPITFSSGNNQAPCNVSPMLEAGYYTVTEKSKNNTGYAKNLRTVNTYRFGGDPYNFAVVPKIASVSNNVGSSEGQIITVTGTGFSSDAGNTVKVAGIDCTILSQSSTEIQCELGAGTVTQDQGYHAGLKLEYYIEKSIDDVKTGALEADVTLARLSAEIPKDYSDTYTSKLSGFFKAPVTGSYKFAIAADDKAQLYFSTTPLDKTTATLLLTMSSYTSYKYFFTKGATQISSEVSLTEGQYYYFYLLHQEGTGSDHASLGVYIPNTQNEISNVPEVQSIAITCGSRDMEIIEFRLNGATGGKWKIKFDTLSSDGKKIQSTTNSSSINYNADATTVSNQIKWTNGQENTVVRTMLAADGSETADAASAVTYVYTATFIGYRTNGILPSIITEALTGTSVTVKVTQIQAPSTPIRGSFIVGRGGLTAELNYNSGTYDVESAMRSLGFQDPIRVSVSGDVNTGYEWRIQLTGDSGADIEPLTVTNTLTGCKDSSASVGVTTLQESSKDLFYESIPFDLLFTANTHPQITVKSNGVQGNCPLQNCDYIIQDTGLPQITAASYASSDLTLSIGSVTQGTYTKDKIRVFFGNVECSVTTYDDSSSTASLVASCPTPEAGIHYPRVHFKNLGYAQRDSGVSSIEIEAVISSISPTEYNPNGGTTFTIAGTGFPASLAAANARGMTLKIGDAVCDATSVSATEIKCVNQATTTPAALIITVNGKTGDSLALTELANVPTITTVSPDDVNPVLQTDITITGTNFDGNGALTSVYIGNSTNPKVQECLVDDATSVTEITCKLLGAPTGSYYFYVKTSNGYTNQVSFEVKTVITGVSPSTGSLAGGTLLTITGGAFSDMAQQTLVFVGDKNIACDVVSSSNTQVTCLTRATSDVDYVEKAQVVYVDTRIVEEAICEDSTNNCQFTYSDSVTPKITSATSSVAPGGAITIAGSGFDSLPSGTAPTVTLNGVELTVTTNTDTSITATVPASIAPAKAAALLVTAQGKGYASFGSGVSNTTEVKPSLISISPSSISTAGALVTISGAGFRSGAQVKIGSKVCEIRSLTTDTIVCKAPGSGSLSLTQGDFTGVTCSGTCSLSTSSSSTPTVSTVSPATSSTSAFDLTITGTKFDLGSVAVNLVLQSDSSVIFAASSITSSSATEIVASFADVAAGVYNVEAISNKNIGTSTATVTVSLTASVSSPVESSIAGGMTLSITGSGFFTNANKDKNKVTVCGFPCAVTDSTSSTINCKTPQFVNAAVLSQYSDIADPVVLTGTSWSDAKTEATVFDMTFTTVYTSTKTACEIGLDLGEHLQGQLSSIKYFPDPKIKGSTMNGTIIEGSNDNITYTKVALIDLNAHDGWNTIPLDSTPVRYRFYRLSGGESSAKCALAELQYHGVLISDSSITDLTALTCTAKVSVNGQTQETGSTAVTYTSAKTATLESISPAHGTSAGGDDVTLSGSGFSTTTANIAVSIDGVACVVKTATVDTIVCTTGAAPAISNRRSSLESELTITFSDQGNVITNGITFFYVDLWSEKSTWGGITPPREGDSVSIPAGQTILLDVSPPKLKAIIVEGALIFDDANINLDCDYIMIRNGRMQIGTWDNPIQNKITITLHGTKDTPQLPSFGNKVIAMMEGILDIHGKKRSHTWTVLDTTAAVDATSITVQGLVDWAVGEQIVIASTDHDHYQSEPRTISAVSQSGSTTTITFTDPLKYRHYAGVQTIDGTNFEMRAEVGLLTRNVVIQGDDQSQKLQYGVHIMAHSDTGDDSSIGRISYTEVRQAGQAFNLGRYPIHFHMIGNVRESFVIGNAVHHTYNRAVTIHGVHYLTIQKNVAYWVMGHTIFIEDGIETHNLIEENLVINTMASTALLNTDQTPASFWITNPNNIFRGNRAAGSDRYGFWFDLRAHPEGPSATDSICPTGERLGEFTNNQAHSSGRYGLRVFHELIPRTYPCQPITPYEANPPIPAEFSDFLGWKNMRSAVIGERLGAVTFKNIKAADNLRCGIEISDGPFAPYGDLVVQDSHIVGTTPENGDDLSKYTDRFVKGLITPRQDNFLAKDIVFSNFADNMYAIETCSHCEHPASTIAGAKTSFFEGLTFNNVVQRVKFNIPEREILIDIDGSLTGTGKKSTVTFFYNHLNVAGCTEDQTLFNGLVCDDTVSLKSLEFYDANPKGNFNMQELNIFRFEDNDNLDMSAVKYRIKNDSWAIPFVTGYTYNLSWASRGDFSSVSFSPSALLAPEDKSITLVFNHSEFRETFDVTRVNNKSLVENTTTLWTTASDSTQLCGDWYHDVDNQLLHVVVNNREQQDIKINSVKCRLNCPPTSGAVEKEEIVRLWSNATQWPGGVVPVANQDVVIPGDWVLKLDVSTASLGNVHVMGDLHFDNTQPELVLTAKTIWVEGQIFIGNNTDDRYTSKAKILLTGVRKSPSLIIGEIQDVSNKVLAVTGNVTMYGNEVTDHFVRLQASVQVGDTKITVPSGVTWKVGDMIFIAPTQRISKEYETHTITAIEGGVLTLADKIKYYHFGATEITKQTTYGVLDMRAEVGLLSRNIVIQGSDEDSWGGRLYVGEVYNSTYDVYYRGRVEIDAVEFVNCGQPNTTLAGITLDKLVSTTNDASTIRKSVVRNSLGYQVRVIGTSGLTFENNIVYSGFKYQVMFENACSGIQFTNNLIVGTNDRGIKSDKGDMAFDYTVNLFADVQFESSLFTGNIIAGCDQTCVLIPGSSCTGNKHFTNNVVHSGESGWIMRAKDTTCTAANKLIAYKLDQGLVSFFATQNIQASNLVVSDCNLGVSLNTGKITADTTFAITDSYFAGLSLTGYTGAYENKTECSGVSGIIIPVSAISEKSVPPSPSSLPWYKVKSDSIFKSSTTVSGVTFENFKDGQVTGCTGNYAFESNHYASDKSSHVKTSGLTLNQVDTSNVIYYNAPDDAWIGIDDCGGWYCTGIKNILVRDLDGSLTGRPASLVPNIPGIYDKNTCISRPSANTFDCATTGWGLLMFDSQDTDALTRILSPINITNSNGYSNALNNFMDHLWDGFYTSLKRLSRYPAVVQTGQAYKVKFTSTIPNSVKWQLQGALASESITVEYGYQNPQSVKIVNKAGVTIPQKYKKTAADAGTISSTDTCGTNTYDLETRKITLQLTGDEDCQLVVSLVNSIQASIRYAVTIEEFFNQNGPATFIDKVAAVLNINPASIRIVSIKSGSTIIQYSIDSNHQGTDTSTKTSAQAEMEKWVKLLNSAVKDGSMKILGSEILNSSASYSLLDEDYTTNDDEKLSKTEKVIIIVAAVVGFLAISVGLYFAYTKMYKKRVITNVVTKKAPVDKESYGYSDLPFNSSVNVDMSSPAKSSLMPSNRLGAESYENSPDFPKSPNYGKSAFSPQTEEGKVDLFARPSFASSELPSSINPRGSVAVDHLLPQKDSESVFGGPSSFAKQKKKIAEHGAESATDDGKSHLINVHGGNDASHNEN